MKITKIKDMESGPAKSKAHLIAIRKRLGFVPNLLATFANSSAMLEGYLVLESAFKKSTLTSEEQQIVLFTASVENSCLYCSAIHAAELRGLHIDPEIIHAIQTKQPVQNTRIEALIQFTRALVSQRGFVPEVYKRQFNEAGFSDIAAMEVLMGIALKTMSNYLDHLNPIAIDPEFQKEPKNSTSQKEDKL